MSDGYGVALCPATIEKDGQLASTRDLLDTAARWVAHHDQVSPREAKARVHRMALPDLLAIPPVRRMLHQAASDLAA
jgi:hypothetical protein